MKALATTCAALLAVAVPAQARPFADAKTGVGVVVGDPIGGFGQMFLTDSQSVDLGIGFSGDAAFWADYVWHDWTLLPQPKKGTLEGWASVGPRLETADDVQFAVRTMLGASYWLQAQPIELFATAGPVFRMTPSGEVDADGGVGMRFYFGGKG
ncbi:MAG: hypothetical protein KGL53_03325 [Elusimicrobia bacterium]|nr:hypothetical protein [Elusimicrobiota bacterium]